MNEQKIGIINLENLKIAILATQHEKIADMEIDEST